MAESTKETVEFIHLTLTKQEAVWLLGVIQNRLHNQSPVEEDTKSRTNGRELYTSLSKCIHGETR